LFKSGINFKVASLNIENHGVEWKEISGVNKRQAEAIRIRISQTDRARFGTLDCTADHKFGIFRDSSLMFKEIEKIILDDEMICVLDKIDIPWKLHYPRLSYLIGALYTDGYVESAKRHKNRRIVFTQKKTSEKIDFINHAQDSFYRIFNPPSAEFSHRRSEEKDSTGVSPWSFNQNLKEGREKFGGGILRGRLVYGSATDFVCNKKDITGEISMIIEDLPAWVLELDGISVFHFLAGVIDGDGTWNSNRSSLHIFNSDEKLTEAIILGCLKLGILPYISIQRGNCYAIQISEKIKEILNFTKRVKGIPRKYKYGSELFSARQLFAENWKRGDIRWPFKPKANRNNLMEKDKILSFLNWNSSSRYNRANIIKALNSPLRMRGVSKDKPLGLNEVYNMDVEDNHNYFVFTKTFTPVLVKNCHGAGRLKSRSAAISACRGRSIARELEAKGIVVMASTRDTLAEEAPEAYKDVNEVVSVVHGAGISKRVCRMRPLGVIKG
jgi:pyruvate,water dikinase